MNTFTKSLASTIRISYMVLPAPLAERFYARLGFYACTVSNLEQYTLAKFIAEGHLEKHINRMRNRYKWKKDRILGQMERSGLFRVAETGGAESGLHFLHCACIQGRRRNCRAPRAPRGCAHHLSFRLPPCAARPAGAGVRHRLFLDSG